MMKNYWSIAGPCRISAGFPPKRVTEYVKLLEEIASLENEWRYWMDYNDKSMGEYYGCYWDAWEDWFDDAKKEKLKEFNRRYGQ